MDSSFLGAGIVERRPLGVLLSTGRLDGGGLSRGSWMWQGWLVGVLYSTDSYCVLPYLRLPLWAFLEMKYF